MRISRTRRLLTPCMQWRERRDDADISRSIRAELSKRQEVLSTAVPRKWNAQDIADYFRRGNRRWIERALLVLWRRQTNEERCNNTTVVDNGVGFNRFDAPLLSSFALQLSRGQDLSQKQLGISSRRLIKYASQLEILVSSINDIEI